jgi:hypothetical protein
MTDFPQADLPPAPYQPPPGSVGYIDYELAETLAQLQLTIEEMAHCLKISRQHFYNLIKKDERLVHAIERGRAIGVANSAKTLVRSAHTKDWKAAEAYLRRFGGLWKDKPAVAVAVAVNNNTEVQSLALNGPTLDQDAMARAARAYLQTRGEVVVVVETETKAETDEVENIQL